MMKFVSQRCSSDMNAPGTLAKAVCKSLQTVNREEEERERQRDRGRQGQMKRGKKK